jgi:hypothetical protein
MICSSWHYPLAEIIRLRHAEQAVPLIRFTYPHHHLEQ